MIDLDSRCRDFATKCLHVTVKGNAYPLPILNLGDLAAFVTNEVAAIERERNILSEQQKMAATSEALRHFGVNAATDVLGGMLSPYWGSVIAGVGARAEQAEADVAALKESLMAIVKALEAGPDYDQWRGACEHAENIAREALASVAPPPRKP